MAKTLTDANAISESGEGRALAEAGRNQVSDRRDVVGADDRDQPLQERHSEKQHQRRAQVDRNVRPAVAHGGAHCAEKRPGRAVDAKGQAVDPRPQARVTRVHGTSLAVERDAEQHQQVADGERREQEARDHRATLVRGVGVRERRHWCAGCIRHSRVAACQCPAPAGSRRRLAAAARS